MLLSCSPIGIIHTNKHVKFDTPHQPEDGYDEHNTIELYPGHNYELALRDLEGFDRIWIIWWFDRNTTWRPLVTPPRGSGKRRGVFATRAPHRPCPIGMTSVPLISIEGRILTVGNVDLLDKTPILDIKPYISSIDSFPDQKHGWLDEESDLLEKPLSYYVALSDHASQQIDWLEKNWGIHFIQRTISILERSPLRSRTHRIASPRAGISRIATGAWRVYFKIENTKVEIIRIAPGYPMELLKKDGFEVIPDWQAQISFLENWEA
jgi:tRNA-Thr(GGU) m(6)t(6)A37 methyltransferase TsaA